ncbi:MAG: ATP-binding cassette domain-containing protein [Alphaproteobacteria bacterium]|nr:ATP-binding cassette domain-containing protein [Alphaproteobacteria bacterium]
MSHTLLLELINLAYSNSLKTCFQEFNTRIHKGERIGIIGPNGCGKSTLLKLLLGRLEPNHGTILKMPKLSFGYLPQNTVAEENRYVFDVASEYTLDVLDDLKKLEEITSSFTKENTVIYEQLLDRLTDQDGFSVPAFLDSLLDRFNLLNFKNKPVSNLSGGQRMQLNLVRLLSTKPDILLLDEPTNHLDQINRRILMDFLMNWKGATLVVSHDVDLLNQFAATIWSFEEDKIVAFKGNYESYQIYKRQENQKILHKLEDLKNHKKKITNSIQDENHRAAQSRKANEGENDRNLKGAMKLKGSATIGKNTKNLNQQKDIILKELSNIRLLEGLKPRFTVINQSKHSLAISITEGKAGYGSEWILKDLNIQIYQGERIAIRGPNGCGKSTLFKAILQRSEVRIEGSWFLPQRHLLGYLDQHYSTLCPQETVMQSIQKIKPTWNDPEVRKHLNDFLFRKNEEISVRTSCLSGGEKARLCLAQIAALSPSVLLLDEITNNLDFEAREHLIQVLNAYKGTLIAISHDDIFLNKINIPRHISLSLGS